MFVCFYNWGIYFQNLHTIKNGNSQIDAIQAVKCQKKPHNEYSDDLQNAVKPSMSVQRSHIHPG